MATAVPERNLLTTLRERVDPVHTALLVVDMQNDYIAVGGAAAQRGLDISMLVSVVPTVATLVEAARSAGVLVVYTQMAMDADLRYLADAEYQRRRLRWGDTPVVVEGTWGCEIVPELAPEADDLVVRKHRASGFVGTDLDQILRSNRVRATVVTGVVTEGCVAATARGAMLADYELTVPLDAVGSCNQQLHDATLLLLGKEIGLPDGVVTADRIGDYWADGHH
jgi:nicotinamidase-related amidase